MSKAPKQIGFFHLYKPEQTTMEYGTHYDAFVSVPFAPGRRHLRLWIPESYDFKHPTPHPVIYFSDGQNMVDEYLTAYGDWHLDRVIRELGQEGYPEPILVGIDCPKKPMRRTQELNPPYPVTKRPLGGDGKRGRIKIPLGYANRFIDYIAYELKPKIDQWLVTDPRVEATGLGGSSMGGIMAFYGFLKYGNTFGYSLSFSPALFFYTDEELEGIMEKEDPRPDHCPLLYLYVGGKEFEKVFIHATDYTYSLLKKRGFTKDNLALVHDPEAKHCEHDWYRHSFDALRFWLGRLK